MIYDLGKLIDLDRTTIDQAIFELDLLPVIAHRRFVEPFVAPKESAYWIKFLRQDGSFGDVSFTRNVHLVSGINVNHVITESSNAVNALLHPLKINEIGFARSIGSVATHVDGGRGRQCAVNIGLKNSSYAITRSFYNGDNSLQMQDLRGVLLHTQALHAVNAVESAPLEYRYIITCGFKEDFEEVAAVLKHRLS